ncbi:MAG TPA: hypothetical protein VFU05_17750 [Cyclobacteriaceae bacterium]|nr:hypothetical protein [Cyclobacteriaceae bacterium]
MKRFALLTFIFILTAIAALFTYKKVDRLLTKRPAKSADALRLEIISSLTNPFPDADTLYLTKGFVCGNASPDDLPTVFDISLSEDEFKKQLGSQVQKPVLTTAEFDQLIKKVCHFRFNDNCPISLADTCRVGKVQVDIRAEQQSPRLVRLFESYLFGNTTKQIQKDFVFDGSNWTFSIVYNSTQDNLK